MGNEVKQIPDGNDHLTAQQLAAWLSAAPQEAASLTADHAALDDHMHTCAACRAQLVMLRQATQLEPELEASPEFDSLLRLGEQAALSAVRKASMPARAVAQPATTSLGWRVWLNWRVALPLAAMLLLAAGGWWWWTTQAPLRKANEALQLAWRDRRPLEARISTMPYAPWIQTRDNSEALTDRMAHDRAERILLEELHERPSPVAAHALGRLYLADRKFDQAISQFETALKATPKDAQLLSDLGAVHIEKGKSLIAQNSESGQNLVEYAEAFKHLERAVAQKGAPLEAFYNRAHCLQLMYLPSQAREAWQKYLELDSSSVWAEEARRSIRLLEEQQKKTSLTREQLFNDFMAGWRAKDEEAMWQAVTQNRNPLDGGMEDRLLDAYLQAKEKGETDQAKESLAALRTLGELVARRTNDRFTTALADYYSRASERRRKISAAGRTLMKAAEIDFKRSRYREAASGFLLAQRSFSQAGNEPETALADFRIGHCYLLEMRNSAAAPVFSKLSSLAEGRSFRWLVFQSFNALAGIKDNSREPTNAIADSLRLADETKHLGDFTAEARAIGLLAGLYRDIGNDKKSIQYLSCALDMVNSRAIDIGQQWNIYGNAGGVFNRFKRVETALEYRKAALHIAKLAQSPLLLSRAYAQLGATYGDLGKSEEAINNIQQAWNYGQALEQGSSGMPIIAHAALQLGNHYRQLNNYTKAIEWYDLSRCLFEQLGQPFYLYVTAKGKFLAAYALHDDQATQVELQAVIQLFEQYRTKIYKESERSVFFDQEQSIYDLAVEYSHVRLHDKQGAFAYAEASRARSLLDLLHTNAPQVKTQYGIDLELLSVTKPLTLSQFQQSLPQQVQLLQYAVLKDRLLIWVITRNRAETFEIATSSTNLSESVSRYHRLIAQSGDKQTAELRAAGQALYGLLIQPVEAVLEKEKTICIVPDKSLYYLPFQSLIVPKTGRYLVEEFKVMYAASASTFIDCTEIASRKGGTNRERLLSVGDPAFDRALFPSLSSLSAARHEATEIARYYSTPLLLTGPDAAEPVVRQGLANAEVAHIATHSVANPASVMASQLVLAKNKIAPTDGGLQAAEIYQLKMPGTRLVVLSACQTGIEQSLNGEGALSLARPFIAAKVPLVVASLWPVDSEATSELMIEFHRQRRQLGLPTIEALRQAQLSLLRSDKQQRNAPYYWSAFCLYGGYAEF